MTFGGGGGGQGKSFLFCIYAATFSNGSLRETDIILADAMIPILQF